MSERLDVDVDRLDELCRQYGIARLEVFGSVVRGELADLFGRPVDLVSRRALHKMLRRTVLDEARLLYAADSFRP